MKRSMRSIPGRRARGRHLYRRHLRARRTQPPDPVEAGRQGRLFAFDKDLQAIATAQQIADPRFRDRARQFRDHEKQRWPRAASPRSTASCSTWAFPRRRSTTRRAVFQLPQRRPARHAHGHHARHVGGQWLATETEQQLEKVIRDYGEERFAFQIAKAIVARRAVEPISSTRQLAGIVANAVKTREKGKDPATRTFQAIRIFINKELEDLEQAEREAYAMLAPGARMAVISFHSLEDRMVKQFLASKAKVAAAGPPPADPRGRPAAAADEADRQDQAVRRRSRGQPARPFGGDACGRTLAGRRTMSGKINLVLAALLVACGLSLVNARYQARHLFIELERCSSRRASSTSTGPSSSWTSRRWARTRASSRSRAPN
jgi:hypothetical protein